MEALTQDRLSHPIADDYPAVQGIVYDEDGLPAGIGLNEWIDRLDRKLAVHYGQAIMPELNKIRRKRKMPPLT